MARNSAGTHSLPATTNPVVTDTPITPTWANGTLSDVSAEITDSLSRSGKGGMLAPMRTVDGSVAAPAQAFTSEPGSGWFRHAAGELRLAILGVYRLAQTATLFTVNSAASVLGTLTASGKVTASAGADVNGTLAVIDDGGTSKKVTVDAPTGLAADYALTLPTALPASTLPVTLTSAGVLATAQLVNAQQNFGTPSAATDVVIKSYFDTSNAALTNLNANLSNPSSVTRRANIGLAWFTAGANPFSATGAITGCTASGSTAGATRIFTIPAGYIPQPMANSGSMVIEISWFDASVSYARPGHIVVNTTGDSYFWANDTAGAKLDLANGDQLYIGQGVPVWVTT